jgi:hypothetical protein
MLFEPDDCVEGVVEDEAAGGGADEVAAGFDEVAAWVDDELLAVEPQAAVATAASTSSTVVRVRRDRVLIAFIIVPVCEDRLGKGRLTHRRQPCDCVPQPSDP